MAENALMAKNAPMAESKKARGEGTEGPDGGASRVDGLRVDGLSVYHGGVRAVDNLSLEVGPNEVVALVGANGAGKSTLLRTIAGLLRARSGSIHFGNRPIGSLPAHRVVEAGVVLVPEGRRVFPDMTVEENLRLGAFARPRRDRGIARDMDEICGYFPILGERCRQPAGTLSGGQQQMVAIGRGLMSKPRLMMLDEPMLGLAPVMMEHVEEIVLQVASMGIAVLLAEQNINLALEVANRGYVLETGRVTLAGPAGQLLANDRVREAYLGL